jgi:hypothetical protein
VKKVDYWLTRFILKARRGDGKPYPANSLYNIATGLLRHFKDDLKRFHLNILAKNDANFSSFKDERNNKWAEKTTKQVADSLTLIADEELFSPSGTTGY